MGRSSRERGRAPVENKPWHAVPGRSRDGPTGAKRDGHRGGSPRFSSGVGDHGEAKVQEGRVIHQDANRDLANKTDFHADEGLEDEQRCFASLLGATVSTPGGPPRLGREKANRREERQEGMSAVTSRRGCVGGTNP